MQPLLEKLYFFVNYISNEQILNEFIMMGNDNRIEHKTKNICCLTLRIPTEIRLVSE